jgi:HEAT repeat protein
MTIAYIERMMDAPARLKGNDREAAGKLVGRWMLTLPAGFVFAVEIKQTDDGCLSLDGPQKGVLYGKFAVRGDRLELVDPNDKEIDDYVWRVESLNKLSLVVSKTNNGADYTGARLERLAEAPKKDDEKKDRPVSAQSDSVFRIPAQAVEQAKRLAAEARSKRTSLKQRRPAGLEDLDTAEAIQRAADLAMKELADEKTNYPAVLRLKYLGDAAFETLVAGTKSENLLVARSSCGALLHRGKKAVAPLCAIIDSEADLAVRSVAIETVGQTFDAEAVPSLIRVLEVKELRVGAMTALQYIRDPRAIEHLKKLVAIGGIGHAAEQAIKHIESPQGYAWCPPELRDLLQLCHDAHTLNGETYGPDDLKRIVEGLALDNSWIGYWCLSALVSLDSTEAVPAIIATPLSESKFQFLAGIGTPAAMEYIIERLHSLNPQTRELAIEGLANGGGRWAAPLLIALLDDPSLTIPGKKDDNDPLGLIDGTRNPLNNWPEWHRAHSALYMFLSRFGMNGQTRNLYLGESNDVREEIKQLKTWWKEHGDDFLAGRNVPNPNLTSVWYNDP